MRTDEARGWRRWRPRPGIGLAALAAAGLWIPASAAAQAAFTWPDTTVDVAKYTTIEECLVAVDRVSDGYKRQEERTVWRDTMAWDVKEPTRAPHAAVTETARRCGARFSAATVPLEDFRLMLDLFLHADRDEDAATLIERRLAALAPDASMERAWVIDSVVRRYLKARPVRLAAALDLAQKLGRPKRAELIERSIEVYGQVLGIMQQTGDTATARGMAREMLAFVDSIPPAERRKLEDKLGPGFGWGVYALMELQTDPKVFLDTLRVSTAAFVAQKRALWARATGERPEALIFPIGERAPTLEADFTFRGGGAAEPRPRRGRVSLVVFNQSECRPYCAINYASIRRIAERFPDLDVTVVTRTRGYFWYVRPSGPAEEAELMQQEMAAYRVPGAVAVTETDFWRLDDPDRRQIMRDVANVTNYTFGKMMEVTRFAAFLVDSDGIIVHARPLGPGLLEDSFAEMIEVLLERQKARS